MNRKITVVLTIIFILTLSLILSGCDNFSLLELINNNISLIPGEVALNLGETIEFEVFAGIPPYVFTEIGDGIISEGVFTAPGTAGTCLISVKDNRNRTAEALVTVVDAIVLTPSTIGTGIGGILQFTISGGAGPYEVVLDPGLGTEDHPDDNTMVFNYTAVSAGLDTIRITDSLEQIKEAYVTVSSSSDLMISPSNVELLVGDTVQFSAAGGTPAYLYTLETALRPGEVFDPVTRIYTAPSSTGIPATVRVSDTLASISDATIYIVDALFTINPSVTITLYVGNEFTFSASNGKLPYTFSILPGGESYATINSSTGMFTALAKNNSVTVIATDANGSTSTCRVKIKS